MTDREQSPAATLGRLMSWIGSIWLIFTVLWGLGVLQGLGLSGSIASAIGSSILPAFILIGVGRAVRKRARVAEDPVQPDVSREPLPTPPVLPRPDTGYEPPRPTVTPAPTPPRPVVVPQKTRVESPKTSQELIEEARRRWGTRP